MKEPPSSHTDSDIVCRVGPWFLKRMAMLIALVAALALYFWYDGAIGYPKKNFNAALFEAFQTGKSGNTEIPDPADFLFEDFSESQKAELKIATTEGQKGETWSKFAAVRHLAASEPEKVTAAEIQQQFTFAWVMGALAVGIGIFTFLERRKALKLSGSEIQLPNRKIVKLEEVGDLDLEKWDRGIAFLKAQDGSILGKIDDYKYEGADQIVKRIQNRS